MDIATACKTVHEWAKVFRDDAKQLAAPLSLAEAVAVIKAYLEREKADGKPIAELAIADYLLMTRAGVRWVMPFALTAEHIEAAKQRREAG